jgi:hypothetical protein
VGLALHKYQDKDVYVSFIAKTSLPPRALADDLLFSPAAASFCLLPAGGIGAAPDPDEAATRLVAEGDPDDEATEVAWDPDEEAALRLPAGQGDDDSKGVCPLDVARIEVLQPSAGHL